MNIDRLITKNSNLDVIVPLCMLTSAFVGLQRRVRQHRLLVIGSLDPETRNTYCKKNCFNTNHLTETIVCCEEQGNLSGMDGCLIGTFISAADRLGPGQQEPKQSGGTELK